MSSYLNFTVHILHIQCLIHSMGMVCGAQREGGEGGWCVEPRGEGGGGCVEPRGEGGGGGGGMGICSRML